MSIISFIIIVFIICNWKKGISDLVYKHGGVSKERIKQNLKELSSPNPVSFARTQTNEYKAKKARREALLWEFEDRHGDWLARQMREERIAYRRVSDMLDLKESHYTNCDSRNLRQMHEIDCQADWVDTGIKKG